MMLSDKTNPKNSEYREGIMKHHKKVLLAAGVVTFAATAFGTLANAESFTLRIGSGHPSKPVAYVRKMEHFFVPEVVKRVGERGKHKVRFIQAYAGTVAKVHETLEAVEKGLLDIGGFCVCFEGAKMMPANIDYFMPFTTPDVRVQIKVKRRMINEHPELYDMLDKKYGQKLIAISGFDNYGLGTKFKWDKVAELKGKKIIAAGPNLPWVKRFGAIPVTTTLPTAYNALATGVASGFIIFPGSYFGFKFHEPAPNWKITNFGSMAQIALTMNSATRKKLPAEVVKIIDEVAVEYEKVSSDDAFKSEAFGLKKLRSVNVPVTTLAVDQQRAWAEALKDWPNERANDMTKDFGIDGIAIMEKYMRYIEEAGHKWPYRYQFKKM